MATPSPVNVPVKAQISVAPAGTPSWLPKIVALLLALAGPGLAIGDPGNKIPSGAVSATIILGSFFIAAIVFTVHLVGENGLSKAGLERTVSEEEAWFKQNYAEIKSTFEAAKPALDQIPGVPAALADVQGKLDALNTRVPEIDRQAVASAVRAFFDNPVAAGVPAGPAPAPAAAPVETSEVHAAPPSVA